MGRPRNEHYWNQVTSEENGTWKCNHCKKKFTGGVARIKAHLGEEKGKGIALCNPDNVSVNEGVNNSIMARSSNPPAVVNGMNSLEVAGDDQMIYSYFDGSMNHQNNAGSSNMVEETGLDVEYVVGSSNSGLESEINKIQELVDNLCREEDNTKEELQWLEYRGKKREREEVDDRLEEVGDLKKRAREMINSMHQGRLTYLKGKLEDLRWGLLLKAVKKTLELSDEPVDDCFMKMRELLKDEKVFFIGVHGMGGVGKTWLVTHFKNQITRKGTSNFENVFWVTVLRDFSILKLQNRIAKRIGIKLDDDNDIIERAEILSSALEKKDRSVLILDDVWNYIDLQKVGIPRRVNGIKLILTSRLKHVFQQMDCPSHNVIQMEPFLDSEDAWKLFLLKLGCHGTPATLAHGVENIARSVVEKCDGLPLGISVLARIMKGVDYIHQWRYALKRSENLAMGEEIGEEVIKVLKLSYDHLMDNNIQNCFLHCALYNRIFAREFIMNLVDEGLIKATGSLEEIFDEGRAILHKLRGHSLLLKVGYKEDYYYDLKMHGLVRDMAHHIMKGRYMVKCNKGLKKIPNMLEWPPCMEKVSLMHNNIEEIPEGTSPRCPQLSTFIFNHNKLRHIPDCFFNCLNALTVLDLSHNQELKSLPSSLSNLRSLKSLLLKGCYSLEYVPSLGDLQELSRLVISETAIEHVPEGLAMLVKLKWLDLSCNKKLTSVPGSVLFNLTDMQYLDLRWTYVTVTEEAENMQRMSMLEYFSGGFQVGKNLVHYVENVMDTGSGPKYYHIFLGIGYGARELENLWEVGHYGEGELSIFKEDGEDRHCVEFGDCEALDHLLPRDVYRLRISRNEQWSGGMCDALSFKAPSSMRRIDVRQCPKLERLLCLSGSCSFCKHLQNLQSLYLHNLETLEDVIWKENGEGICLPNLSHLEIWGCNRMEKLLTPLSLRQLPNLETIEVRFCDSMKEILAVESSEDDNIDSTITLPNSFKFDLWNLPQLKTLCTRIIVSDSPPRVDVFGCPNLIKGSLRYKSSRSDSEPVVLW